MSVGENDLQSSVDGILLEMCISKIFNLLNRNMCQSFYNKGYS